MTFTEYSEWRCQSLVWSGSLPKWQNQELDFRLSSVNMANFGLDHWFKQAGVQFRFIDSSNQELDFLILSDFFFPRWNQLIQNQYTCRTTTILHGVKRTHIAVTCQSPSRWLCHWRISSLQQLQRRCKTYLQLFSEILVPHICGGLKLKFRKFQKSCSSSSDLSCIWKTSNAIEWTIWNWGWMIGHHFWRFWAIEGHLITQHTLSVEGDPALMYTILMESTKQLGLLRQVKIFTGEQGIGFQVEGAGMYIQYHWLHSWSELLCAYILSLSLIHHHYILNFPNLHNFWNAKVVMLWLVQTSLNRFKISLNLELDHWFGPASWPNFELDFGQVQNLTWAPLVQKWSEKLLLDSRVVTFHSMDGLGCCC